MVEMTLRSNSGMALTLDGIKAQTQTATAILLPSIITSTQSDANAMRSQKETKSSQSMSEMNAHWPSQKI
jgi:hypothetical protein